MVECFAPTESTLERDGPELPRKSPCPRVLPPALSILSHSYFTVTSHFLGEAGWDNLYSTTSPKQAVYKKSLGTDLCYRLTTKALYRGYTNCAPQVAPPAPPHHVAHSILQGYQSKSSHVFLQLNQWPWKQFQSNALHYDHNQIFMRLSCK